MVSFSRSVGKLCEKVTWTHEHNALFMVSGSLTPDSVCGRPAWCSLCLRLSFVCQKLKKGKTHQTWINWMTEHIPCELPFPRNSERECLYASRRRPCSFPTSAVNIYPSEEGVHRGISCIACQENIEDFTILDCGIGICSLVFYWPTFTVDSRANSAAYLSCEWKAECLSLNHFLTACTPDFVVCGRRFERSRFRLLSESRHSREHFNWGDVDTARTDMNTHCLTLSCWLFEGWVGEIQNTTTKS